MFCNARTPKEIAALPVQDLDEIIRASTFQEAKAQQIHEIAGRTEEEFKGVLPCDPDILLTFRGVGPKCANLVLGIACGVPLISVDIHVHRVTNRWGLIKEKTPEKTLIALTRLVPEKHWIELNELLVPFGKHICTLQKPKCSSCPVLTMCQQVGVTIVR